jgi:hypothetical protein
VLIIFNGTPKIPLFFVLNSYDADNDRDLEKLFFFASAELTI